MNNDQDCALRKLYQLLSLDIESGVLASLASEVLESAINTTGESLGILDFFYILRQASVEARNINTISNVKTYIRVLDSLQGFVLSNDVYKAQWNDYKNYIDNCNCMPIIDSLANYYRAC